MGAPTFAGEATDAIAEAVEAHALIMGPGYSVVEGGPADLAEVIAVVAPEDDFVALDPPLAQEGGDPQPVRGIPTEEFLERLREEAREESSPGRRFRAGVLIGAPAILRARAALPGTSATSAYGERGGSAQIGWAAGPYSITLTELPEIWMSTQVKLLVLSVSENQSAASAVAVSR